MTTHPIPVRAGLAALLLVLLAFILALLSAACGPVDVHVQPGTPAPVPDPALVAAIERDCQSLYETELGREIDTVGMTGCRARGLSGEAGWQEVVRAILQASDEYQAHQLAQNPPADRQVLLALIRQNQYQGNFGTIKLPGCGLHMDSLFDPFLLIKWVEDKACFERMMQAHMDRGDNIVAVDPRSGYHGHNDVDLWHEPERFAAFLRDVRSHRNKYGEFIRVHVFFAGDGHIGSMLDAGSFEHWRSDVDALAAAAEPYIDSTVVCWECRHQSDYVNARTYIEMGRYLAQKFPRAVHAQHLIAGSSSWSSWRCDPLTSAECDPSGYAPPVDRDDPNRGNEAAAWTNCRAEGWCDLFLYQFDIGDEYLHPDNYPNYTGNPGVLGRWTEIVERLGDDERSLATSHGNRRGWVQVPVVAFEFVYDAYWDRGGTEAYAVAFCQRALAIGGRGCGSASWRLP